MANGEVMVPLPEMDKSEEPMVANLLIQGVNQMAQRLTSRLPDIEFPSTNPGNTAADRRADNARLAVLGWWDMNQLQRRLAKRARYLVAYGNAPAYIRPVSPNPLDQRSMPYWSFLNPLSVYPAYAGEDEIEALNAVIHRQVSLAWLKARYPRQATFLYKGSSPAPDKMFDLLEWNDGEETVMVVRGAMREERAYIEPSQGTAPYMELERAPNRAGVCLITCPGMISLDKPSGLFDHIIGMFYAQSKLAAYEHIAIRQSIFPEKWVVTHPGSPGTARIVVPADGRMGVIGEVENGTITALNAQPSPLVSQAIDRLERNARVQSSIPSDWGAESATNIRTARRGEQVASSASDPTLGELQEIFAEALEKENSRGIRLMKALYPNRMFSFQWGTDDKRTSEDYRPNDVFDSDFHYVKYSMPGVDAASIPIELGQRLQTGTISMETARQADPLVEDPQFEAAQTDIEGLRHALLTSLEARAQNGTLDPHQLALIAQIRAKESKPLEDCVADAQRQVQAEQASTQSAEPGAPETQPGLGTQPQPGGPGPGAAGPPPLSAVLQQLRGPTNQSPSEKALTPTG